MVTLLGQLTQEIAKADAQVDEAYESYLKNTYSTQEAKLERGWQSCVKRRKMLYKERKAAAMHLSRPGVQASLQRITTQIYQQQNPLAMSRCSAYTRRLMFLRGPGLVHRPFSNAGSGQPMRSPVRGHNTCISG